MSSTAEETLYANERRGRLLKVLGVGFGLAVVIGGTIGMGILRTPGEVAARLPSAWLFVGVWLLGGLYALLGAFSVAELSAMLPRSGGFYVFARRALGEYPGFVVGWTDWLSTCGSTAGASIVVAEYAGVLSPRLAPWATAVALAVALTFAALQWRGVREGGLVQNVTSLVKTVFFLLLVLACFVFGGAAQGGAAAETSGAAQGGAAALPAGMALVAALVVALQGVIYTYDGWYGVAYFGEEVRNPGRDIPRAMIGGVLLVIAIYLLVNLALVYVLPLGRIAGDKLAVGTAAETVFGAWGTTATSLLAMVSLLSAINAFTLCASRTLFAMSRDGLFPRQGASVNRGGTPTVALLVSTTVAALFILTGTFNQVLAVVAFFFVTNYAVAFLSVFVLRRREPRAERPYRAWGYPVTTGLALAGSLVFLAGAIAGDTQNSVYALALLAVSYPVYLAFRRVLR